MLQLARIFQDGMVLQREKPIRIWGHSDLRETLNIYLNEQLIVGDIPVEGDFVIGIPAQHTLTGATIVVQGRHDHVELKDVDFGEVWVAGGQSNMEFPLMNDAEAIEFTSNADDSHLRFYDVGKYAFEGEETEGLKDNSGWDKWLSFKFDNVKYFSAVGFYFAKVLKDHYKVPVGIVGCNWGGTTALTWADESYFETDQDLRIYIEEYRKKMQSLDIDSYIRKDREGRELMASPVLAHLEHQPKGLKKLLNAIQLIMMLPKLISNANLIGPRSHNRPGGLYHNMVAKIAGFTSRGIIWYQGESDDKRAEAYASLFSKVIRCWRDSWADELPILYVQLAPFGTWMGQTGKNYPIIRAQQAWVSEHIEAAYMISIMDAGMKKDIHPKHKRPVGERLALMARNKIYGENILSDAPELSGAEVKDGRLVLMFANTGEGLSIKGATLSAMRIWVNKKEIKKYFAAILGGSIEIQNKTINSEVEVEVCFAWEAYCEVNLFNSSGLPAKPFQWKNKHVIKSENFTSNGINTTVIGKN